MAFSPLKCRNVYFSILMTNSDISQEKRTFSDLHITYRLHVFLILLLCLSFTLLPNFSFLHTFKSKLSFLFFYFSFSVNINLDVSSVYFNFYSSLPQTHQLVPSSSRSHHFCSFYMDIYLTTLSFFFEHFYIYAEFSLKYTLLSSRIVRQTYLHEHVCMLLPVTVKYHHWPAAQKLVSLLELLLKQMMIVHVSLVVLYRSSFTDLLRRLNWVLFSPVWIF